MKPRILLASAPLTREERYGKYSQVGNSQPTFALVSLASVALQSGANVKIIDASAKGYSVSETMEEVSEYKPDIIGISSTTLGIFPSGELAQYTKEAFPHARTVIGGCHVTAIPDETMNEFPSFDFAVLGEGEETFQKMIESFSENDVISDNLEGTIARNTNGLKINPPRPLIKDLDSLPLPSWNHLPGFPHDFIPSPGRIKRTPCASIVLTRGCPNRCNFCDRSVFGSRVRFYSPEYAISMIKDLRENYGVKEILIEDDTFITSRKWVNEFCERLISEKVDITWSCLGRADRADLDMFRLMKRAGCWHISFGIESGDPQMLEEMNKRETLEQIRTAVQYSHEAGLRTKGFFIIGYPGETKSSMETTKKFTTELYLDDISIMQFTPFPGSTVYNGITELGDFDRNWRHMNILNTVFIPHGLSTEDMKNASNAILRSFYFRPRIIFQKIIDIIINPKITTYYLKSLYTLITIIFKKDSSK